MNIRTISNPIVPIEKVKIHNARGVVTDVSSEDRDPNGRRDHDNEPDKSPLDEDEMKRAQEYLDNLTGLKANGLSIELEPGGEFQVFVIKDHDGEVVRRIVEWEMRALIDSSDKKVGQIFDRAV